MFAQKRKTFGKPLIKHGVIRNKLVRDCSARKRRQYAMLLPPQGHMARQIEATQAWLHLLTYNMEKLSPLESMIKLAGPISLVKVRTPSHTRAHTRAPRRAFRSRRRRRLPFAPPRPSRSSVAWATRAAAKVQRSSVCTARYD